MALLANNPTVPMDSRLRFPPRNTTFMSSLSFSFSQARKLLVTTVTFFSSRYSIRWMVVDPESMIMVLPGLIREAALLAMAFFSISYSARVLEIRRASPFLPLFMDPPWVRINCPCSSSTVRSVLMVTALTPRTFENSSTVT